MSQSYAPANPLYPQRILIVTDSVPDADGAAAAALKKERAQRLLAEMRLQEERQNRLVLERALAHVCADLHRRDAIAPAVLKVMERIEDLTDFVMGDSPI